jgi:hypothetical protein
MERSSKSLNIRVIKETCTDEDIGLKLIERDH